MTELLTSAGMVYCSLLNGRYFLGRSSGSCPYNSCDEQGLLFRVVHLLSKELCELGIQLCFQVFRRFEIHRVTHCLRMDSALSARRATNVTDE